MNYLRLKKKKDFSKIIKTGKRIYGGTVTAVYLPSDRLKMAVCVGKKYGKSVQRNRINRLLRESFRLYADKFTCPVSVLLIPKVREEYSFSSFSHDMEKILKREKLIEN